MNKLIVKTSKFLSLVLRHKPDEIGISLDENGWVNIDLLIEAANRRINRSTLTREFIKEVVLTNDKQRFSISEDGESIRANQGHSINIDLELTTKTPPPRLFHGTVEKYLNAIESKGLIKMRRQHVHLSENLQTATTVGSRRGEAIILVVNSKQMSNDGYEFYQSTNGVWLTESVPYRYITNFRTKGNINVN